MSIIEAYIDDVRFAYEDFGLVKNEEKKAYDSFPESLQRGEREADTHLLLRI